jgi:hypothetical protein
MKKLALILVLAVVIVLCFYYGSIFVEEQKLRGYSKEWLGDIGNDVLRIGEAADVSGTGVRIKFRKVAGRIGNVVVYDNDEELSMLMKPGDTFEIRPHLLLEFACDMESQRVFGLLTHEFMKNFRVVIHGDYYKLVKEDSPKFADIN